MLPKLSRFKSCLLLSLSSVIVTACGFSFEHSRSQLNLAVFPVSREHLSAARVCPITDRIVARLEEAELHEVDPWQRDAIRIARITVLYAAKNESHAHFWATYQVLGTSPDQVWPSIVAQRKAKLGKAYSQFYDENDLWRGGDLVEMAAVPKKPAASVTMDRIRQNARAATA